MRSLLLGVGAGLVCAGITVLLIYLIGFWLFVACLVASVLFAKIFFRSR